jgi:oligoribonuclease NrnB/cAMP/cGMP phosphodiesterase (DHH superfamily)
MNISNIFKGKLLQPDEVDVVIYHSPCSDGTGAGYSAWKYFQLNNPSKNVKFLPMSIGAHPPPDITGSNVLICDYSYRKDIIRDQIMPKVNKFLIIDHHKSAEDDLIELDDKYKIFNMNYSGAVLTWMYFFPDTKVPLMLEYIQDRDIWTKKLPNTDDFSSWFYTLPQKFEEYDKYLDDNLLFEMIKVKGSSFSSLNEYYTSQAVDYAIPKFCKIKGKYYLVAYVNSTICKSDVGNKIFEKYPLIDFSAVYSISDATNSTSFSLRSTPKHADVSTIAFSFGGGGHKCASGIRVDYVANNIPSTMLDNGQLYKILDNIYFKEIEINNNKYNVAYLNTQYNKYDIANYLLQTKYVDKNNYPVQVAENLYTEKNNVNGKYKINIVVIFDYDVNHNMTEYNILFDDTVNKTDRTSLVMKYTNEFNVDNPYVTFIINNISKVL